MSETHGSHEAHAGEEKHEQHIVTPATYALIFAALLVGTAITVVASYIDMGPWNPVVALGIAVTKATLVVLYFMHIKYSSKLMKLTVGAGVFTFLILVGMSMSDYISRAWGQW
jgi:cytochrome c oxidase subunit 4